MSKYAPDMPQQPPQPLPSPQWQQPSYPQQAPPYPQPQPPMRPAKTRKPMGRGVKIGCGAVAALVVLVTIIAIATGAGGKSSTTTPTPQATQPATQQPTKAPTAKPTPAVVLTGNQVVVGGTESAFTAKFGNPISQTTQNGAPVLMYATHDSNIGQFGVVLFPGTHTVYGIVIAPPAGQTWDAVTAITVSVAYLPDDATLNQPQNVTDSSGTVTGLYQSGFSAELANSLSPAHFNDASGNNLVKPGTFSVKFTYSDSTGTQANLCSIRLGEQSTTS